MKKNNWDIDLIIQSFNSFYKDREMAKKIVVIISSFLHDLNINHTIWQYELNEVIDKWKSLKDHLCEKYDINTNLLSDKLI